MSDQDKTLFTLYGMLCFKSSMLIYLCQFLPSDMQLSCLVYFANRKYLVVWLSLSQSTNILPKIYINNTYELFAYPDLNKS